MSHTPLSSRIQRLAAGRPLLFALACTALYGAYGWAGQAAKAAGSRWGDLGSELAAGILAVLILGGLDWWRRAGFAAPRWRSLWVIIPYLVYLAGGYRGFVTAWTDTLYFAVSALLIGFQEEAWLRGIFLEALRPRYGVYGAVILSSVLFGVLHLTNLLSGAPVETVLVQVMATLLFGLVFAGIRLQTGSIWLPILLHAVTDFFPHVGTSTSAGMEPAPVLVLATMALLILAYGVALLWGAAKRQQSAPAQ